MTSLTWSKAVSPIARQEERALAGYTDFAHSKQVSMAIKSWGSPNTGSRYKTNAKNVLDQTKNDSGFRDKSATERLESQRSSREVVQLRY